MPARVSSITLRFDAQTISLTRYFLRIKAAAIEIKLPLPLLLLLLLLHFHYPFMSWFYFSLPPLSATGLSADSDSKALAACSSIASSSFFSWWALKYRSGSTQPI